VKKTWLAVCISLACHGSLCYSQIPTTSMNEVEPNNEFNTATEIPLFLGETVIAGSTIDSSDYDFFKIEVPSGKRLSILFGGFNTVKRRVFYLWQWGIALDMKVKYENPYWSIDNSKIKYPATWKNELRWYEKQCEWQIVKADDGKIHYELNTSNCGMFAEGPIPTPNGDGAVEITVINNFNVTILDSNLNDVSSGFQNSTGGSIGVSAFGSMRDKKFVYSNTSESTNHFYIKIRKGDPRYFIRDYDFNVHIE